MVTSLTIPIWLTHILGSSPDPSHFPNLRSLRLLRATAEKDLEQFFELQWPTLSSLPITSFTVVMSGIASPHETKHFLHKTFVKARTPQSSESLAGGSTRRKIESKGPGFFPKDVPDVIDRDVARKAFPGLREFVVEEMKFHFHRVWVQYTRWVTVGGGAGEARTIEEGFPVSQSGSRSLSHTQTIADYGMPATPSLTPRTEEGDENKMEVVETQADNGTGGTNIGRGLGWLTFKERYEVVKDVNDEASLY
jgi:hypothetical protein